MLVRAQYVRDHRTETYLRLLEGVHIREVMAEEAARLPQGQPSAVKEADLGSDMERQFAARLRAFGSQRVWDLYADLDRRTTELVAVLNGMRVIHEMPPAAIEGIEQAEEVGGRTPAGRWCRRTCWPRCARSCSSGRRRGGWLSAGGPAGTAAYWAPPQPRGPEPS